MRIAKNLISLAGVSHQSLVKLLYLECFIMSSGNPSLNRASFFPNQGRMTQMEVESYLADKPLTARKKFGFFNFKDLFKIQDGCLIVLSDNENIVKHIRDSVNKLSLGDIKESDVAWAPCIP